MIAGSAADGWFRMAWAGSRTTAPGRRLPTRCVGLVPIRRSGSAPLRPRQPRSDGRNGPGRSPGQEPGAATRSRDRETCRRFGAGSSGPFLRGGRPGGPARRRRDRRPGEDGPRDRPDRRSGPRLADAGCRAAETPALCRRTPRVEAVPGTPMMTPASEAGESLSRPAPVSFQGNGRLRHRQKLAGSRSSGLWMIPAGGVIFRSFRCLWPPKTRALSPAPAVIRPLATPLGRPRRGMRRRSWSDLGHPSMRVSPQTDRLCPEMCRPWADARNRICAAMASGGTYSWSDV